MKPKIKVEDAVLEAIAENRDFIFTGTTEAASIKLNYYSKEFFKTIFRHLIRV